MKPHKFIKTGHEFVPKPKQERYWHAPVFSFFRKYDRLHVLKCKICGIEIRTKDFHIRKFNDWKDDCDMVIASKVHDS